VKGPDVPGERSRVPCGTCGTLTTPGTPIRCGGCLEIESNIAEYLRRGGAKAMAFVAKALHEACEQATTPVVPNAE